MLQHCFNCVEFIGFEFKLYFLNSNSFVGMFEYRKEKGKKKETRQPKPSTSRPSSSLSPPLPAWAAPLPSFPSPASLSPLSLFLHGPARASPPTHVRSRPRPLSLLPSSARPAPPVRRFFPLAPSVFSPVGPASWSLAVARTAAPWALSSVPRPAELRAGLVPAPRLF
jgi:hypothetical protein